MSVQDKEQLIEELEEHLKQIHTCTPYNPFNVNVGNFMLTTYVSRSIAIGHCTPYVLRIDCKDPENTLLLGIYFSQDRIELKTIKSLI